MKCVFGDGLLSFVPLSSVSCFLLLIFLLNLSSHWVSHLFCEDLSWDRIVVSGYTITRFRVVIVPFSILKSLPVFALSPSILSGFSLYFGGDLIVPCVFGIFDILLLVPYFRVSIVPFFTLRFFQFVNLFHSLLLGFTSYFGDNGATPMCFRDILYHSTCVLFFVMFLCYSSYLNIYEFSP